MHYFKKTLLAAAMAAFSLTVAFPAFADEPVGTDVTIAGPVHQIRLRTRPRISRKLPLPGNPKAAEPL